MSYISAVEQAIEEKEDEAYSIRLAKVTAVNSGKPYVTFYGESTQSTTTYKHIDGYKPAVNDIVAMMRQAKTYIILGKVTDDFTAEVQYATKSSVDDIVNGTTTVGSATKATGDKNGADITTTYAKANHSHNEIVNGSYNLELSAQGDVIGSALRFGNRNNNFEGYFTKLYHAGYHYQYYIDMTGNVNSSPTILPSANRVWNVGIGTQMFNNVYAYQFYQNGTAISTSDRNKKNTISDLADKFKGFFNKLRPVTFKFNDGEAGRLHAGFIAQEVEEAMHESGINNAEFGGLVIQDDGSYALRYEEFIAVQTAVIQDLQKRVEELERRMNGE